MINFIHIPKTAGTSFRFAAEDVFGANRIVYDYGKAAPETSALVHQHVYQKPDFWAFYQACERADVALVGGHMNCDRFVAGFGVEKIVTFVRDPLQRIASEYKHFVRHKNYQGSFEEFYTQPKNQNRLSRAFREVPAWAAGFVGVTERYDESLELLHKVTGIRVPAREENMGKARVEEAHEFSPGDLKAMTRLNRKDIGLYRQVSELFNQRLLMLRQGLPFVHGHVDAVSGRKIAGTAWWDGCRADEPVVVEVLVNGVVVGHTVSAIFQPKFCAMKSPRGGHVGFQMPLEVREGDQVSCRVSETGQLLGERTLPPDNSQKGPA